MDYVVNFLKSAAFKRFLALCVLVIGLYFMRSMINMLLMTFLFSYVFYYLDKMLKKRFPSLPLKLSKLLQLVVFVVVLSGVVYAVINFIPDIVLQIQQVSNQVMDFYNEPTDNEMLRFFKDIIEQAYLAVFSEKSMGYATKLVSNIGHGGLNVLLSLVLSIFFMLGNSEIARFTAKFKESKISALYHEIAFFGEKFVSSFGKVIEVQILIAFLNGVFSIIGLKLIGFPNIIGFGVMIFVLGLIPVAGVIISLIPLCLVAFSINGLVSVAYVLIMIVLLHAMESYILNPKLMSSKTKLPVFYTFTILIFSEHFFGIWGLIVGIPMFMFILEILEVPLNPMVEAKDKRK